MPSELRRISCYVEQEEALLGALTVRETLYFAAKISLPSYVQHYFPGASCTNLNRSVTKAERMHRIEALLSAIGLSRQANVIVGTPIRTGISGGQKRRLTVASQLITGPKAIFLDEPTSGLDSQAAYEVMSFVKNIAVKYNLLVVASIHQPATSTFGLFDQLLLLSQGRTVYNGSIHGVGNYFERQGYPMPQYINPAEFVLGLISTDFATNQELAESKLQALMEGWDNSSEALMVEHEIIHARNYGLRKFEDGSEQRSLSQKMLLPLTLVHRSFIKSYRDVIAYGIRIAMYMGLALLMGTVWLRLSTSQNNIIAFTNAIFYGGAFMSFMAVAYIPSYLEDRSLYIKERANGLYGPTAFMISNLIIGIPFLFLITVLFSVFGVFVIKLSSNSRWILDLGTLVIPGSFGSRIPSCSGGEHLPSICGVISDCRFCKWTMDECEWFHGSTKYAQRLLEICIPLHRLPSICLQRYDGQRILRSDV